MTKLARLGNEIQIPPSFLIQAGGHLRLRDERRRHRLWSRRRCLDRPDVQTQRRQNLPRHPERRRRRLLRHPR